MSTVHSIDELRTISSAGEQAFQARYAPLEEKGWSPQLRHRFGYFSPDDYYELLMDRLVTEGCEWADIGCATSATCDVMLMIDPPPASAMCRPTACPHRYWPFRLTPST